MTTKNLQTVNKENPCLHCGKTDWCYRLLNNGLSNSLSDKGLSVCKRGAIPASGWKKTSKKDRDGDYYYAPIESQDRKTKQPRIKNKRIWEYPFRNGKNLVRVIRIDDGFGKKFIWQEYWLKEAKLAKFRTEKYWVKLSQKDLDKGKCTQAQFDLFKKLTSSLRQEIPIYRYQENTTSDPQS